MRSVYEASEEDTNRAVAAAKTAQPAWAALTAEDRGVYFKKLASLIREHNDELATLEALSMGIPKSQYFHAFACASVFDHYAEAGYTMQGSTSLNTPGYINMTLRQPYGVVAAIIPWNVPLLFFANKVAPALTVGNTVVLKSSEKAPLTVSQFFRYWIAVGGTDSYQVCQSRCIDQGSWLPARCHQHNYWIW